MKLAERARANGVRLYGRRPARNRAGKALRCAERDVGPMALSHPDAKVSG